VPACARWACRDAARGLSADCADADLVASVCIAKFATGVCPWCSSAACDKDAASCKRGDWPWILDVEPRDRCVDAARCCCIEVAAVWAAGSWLFWATLDAHADALLWRTDVLSLAWRLAWADGRLRREFLACCLACLGEAVARFAPLLPACSAAVSMVGSIGGG